MKTKNIFYGLFTIVFGLLSMNAGVAFAQTYAQPSSYPAGTYTYGNSYNNYSTSNYYGYIGLGSSGAQVTNLQIFLQNRGYLYMPAGVDYGYFGPLTQNALIRFQANNRLSQTGYLDSATQSAINTYGGYTYGNTGSYPTYPNTGNLSCPTGFTLTTYNGVFGCFLFLNGNNSYNNYNNNYNSNNSADARLSNFDVSRGDDTNLQEDDNDQEVMIIEFDVDDADIELDRVNIDFEFTGSSSGEDKPWKVFDEIRLLSDGDEIDSIDGSDEDEWDKQDSDTYEISFRNLSETIRENDTAHLTLEVDVQRNISGANGDNVEYKLFVPDDGIRGFDDSGDTEEIGDDSDSVRITIDSN